MYRLVFCTSETLDTLEHRPMAKLYEQSKRENAPITALVASIDPSRAPHAQSFTLPYLGLLSLLLYQRKRARHSLGLLLHSVEVRLDGWLWKYDSLHQITE